MPDFKQIQRSGYLPDRIASQILGQITRGELKPGDALPTETALGGIFGVSRNVVREAIARLRSDGVVSTKQGRGAVVSLPSERTTFRIDVSDLEDKENLKNLFEMREVIEVEVAGIAAQRRSASDMSALGRALQDMRDKKHFEEMRSEADCAFHCCIGRATGNTYLATIVDYLTSRLKEVGGHANINRAGREVVTVILSEHQSIFEAIANRQVAEARRSMHFHLRGSAERHGLSLT